MLMNIKWHQLTSDWKAQLEIMVENMLNFQERNGLLDQSSVITKSIASAINFKLMLTILICIF